MAYGHAMPNSSDFLTHLKEQLAGLGPVAVRRMFGGAGIFYEDMMFALVADDTLYFKADAENEHHFEDLGLARFSYEAKGQRRELSYRRAPEDVLDDSDAMIEWARIAIAAALRANASKPAAKSKARRKPREASSK